jgi:branched-subunit amino acid transport protein
MLSLSSTTNHNATSSRGIAPAPPQGDPNTPPLPATTEDRGIFGLTMLAVLVIFSLLANRWWVPGGDSDMYLVIARSLAQGNGYCFNGAKVAVAPPGWPVILAGAMKISISFAFLKCLNLVLLTAFLGMYFWIVRRFVPGPRTAAAVVIGTALLSNVYELSFWFHSDPFFCALTALSVLLALQMREGRNWSWRAPLLVALCVAWVFVRWAGPLDWCLIAGILLSEKKGPRLKRAILISGLAFVLITATFLGLRHALKLTPTEQRDVKNGGILVDDTSRTESQGYNFKNIRFSKHPLLFVSKQLSGAGHWFSWLFWEPLRLNPVHTVSGAVGWLAILLFATHIVQTRRRRDWIWLGLALPCAALFMVWTGATPRYLVPYTPLLLVAILTPLTVFARGGVYLKVAARILLITFIVSAALCNITLYGIEVWVNRQSDFYGAYYCGLDKDLISACHRLSELGITNTQVAISPRYENMGRVHQTRFGIRAAAVLTDRSITPAPMKDKAGKEIRPPPGQAVIYWAHESNAEYIINNCRRWPSCLLVPEAHLRNIKYYLCQPTISPWRWHFRLTWLQKIMDKKPIVEAPTAWQIWDVSGPTPVRIDVPQIDGWPMRVPGLRPGAFDRTSP